MSLQFLYPNWLWALLLISVPIIIHLFNFRRYKQVYFTNVHLLKEVKKDLRSSTRVKELLILLSRILLVAFLVFAFAQPIWIDQENKDTKTKNADLVIVLDNSFSMSAEGKEGILLESAKRKAMEVINAYPASTKTMIITTEALTDQLVFKTKEQALIALSQIKISPFTYSLNRIVDVVNTRNTGERTQKSLFIISDFQKSDYKSLNSTDRTEKIYLIPLESPIIKNLILDTCYFNSPIHNLIENESLVYSLSNNGTEDVVDFTVNLYINDSLKAISNVDIKAGQTIKDTFNYRNSSEGMVRGKLSFSDFPISYDNQLYFNYEIKKNLKVGIYSDDNMYLNAFFKNNAYYKSYYFDLYNIQMELWHSADILIVNTNKELSTGLQEEIQKHVEQSKALVVFLNKIESNIDFWNTLGIRFSSKDSSEKQISKLNMNSSVFKNSFIELDHKLNLSKLKFSSALESHFEWLIKTQDNKIVAALKDKDNQKILIIGIPPTKDNRAFYTHPVFIPLLYNFMSDAQKNLQYYYSNTNTTFFVETEKLEKDNVLSIWKEKEQTIPEQYSVNSGIKIHFPRFLEAGYYTIKSKQTEINGFSINYSRKESLADFYSKEELEIQASTMSNIKVFDAESINSNTIAQDINHRKDLWFYSILLALLFIISEILLILFFRK